MMVILLAAGVLLMTFHHWLYTYLDGRPVTVQQKFGITGQKATSVLGNLIAYVARTVLAAAISIAFSQSLWSHLSENDNSIKQINALVSCQHSPFSPSSLPAWRLSTLFLMVVAISGTAMSIITVFASSSLTIIPSSTPYSRPCKVGAPDLAHGDLGQLEYNPYSFQPRYETDAYTHRIILQGSPSPPKAWCNGSCQYDIQFMAPALNCTDTTKTANFEDLLPTYPAITIWNSSYVFDDYNGLVVEAAIYTEPRQAARCEVLNATYTTHITETDSTTSIQILGLPKLHNSITYTDSGAEKWLGLAAVGESFARAVGGVIRWDEVLNDWTPDTSMMVYSNWMIQETESATYPNIPKAVLITTLSSLMHNISISIASGQLDQPGSDSVVLTYATTCHIPATRYSYNPQELLVTYGGCIFLTIICLFFGWSAQHHSKPGSPHDSLDFSRIVAAIINEHTVAPTEAPLLTEEASAVINPSVDETLESRRVLTEQTRLKLEYGQFYIVE